MLVSITSQLRARNDQADAKLPRQYMDAISPTVGKSLERHFEILLCFAFNGKDS